MSEGSCGVEGRLQVSRRPPQLDDSLDDLILRVALVVIGPIGLACGLSEEALDLPLMPVIVLEYILESLGDLSVNGIVDLLIALVFASLLASNGLILGFLTTRLDHLNLSSGMGVICQITLLLLLLLLVDEGIKPLEGVNQLSRQTELATLKLVEILLVLGQLATDTQGLQRHWL